MKDLNVAINKDINQAPTREKMTHKFASLTVFTDFDGHNTFWCITLGNQTSLLATCNSSFGRFCYLCLPFGLVCFHIIFQYLMDQILEWVDRIVGIASGIILTAKDDAAPLYHSPLTYGSCLDNKKWFSTSRNSEIKAPLFYFFGCIHNKHGIWKPQQECNTT